MNITKRRKRKGKKEGRKLSRGRKERRKQEGSERQGVKA
jgi:hypothetical protein